ncbi:glycosyltransferase family 2 protein [Nocardia sp. NPDC046473]|uniref:glycosyltransferase family 2 protein n=1 Tax=Nocardia sp. NPDC046473 TaxID=3155733 RepID=UPI0033DC01F2
MIFIGAALLMFEPFIAVIGPVLVVGTAIIGIRMLSYWRSFVFHWRRYRKRETVSTADLLDMNTPFVKIQITTRGSTGSTEVILRGIRNIMELAGERPDFYRRILSVEVVTESDTQAQLLERAFDGAPVAVHALRLPADYRSPRGTELKARALHYAVERRRAGWNHKPGRTFIAHFDEESVMVPAELRKLVAVLTDTDKKILEGPIHYPLDYRDASAICRAMEANRPIGCFECRHVMERGFPLHLHGSNLVIDEEFENELGWDIGLLDGQPLIAEDYVFGVKAFLHGGSSAFGWHGCVILEQPPFSFRSALKQRHRWVFGVLQGIAITRRDPAFQQLPLAMRRSLVWGTRLRIATFALGSVVGTLSLLILPLLLCTEVTGLVRGGSSPLGPVLTASMAVIGSMWLGSVVIGAWYNVADAGLTRAERSAEICRAVLLAPIAGVSESTAALRAVVEWIAGRRKVSWHPTPKTKAAEAAINRRSTT